MNMEQTASKPCISRIGVVNWDCSLPSTTFFGYHATKSLGPAKFRDRTPYYAQEIAKDQIEYSNRTVEEYEIEMRYAIEAGIDYFAYCWYDHIVPSEQLEGTSAIVATADKHVRELTRARSLHAQSALREKLHYCGILISPHPYSDESLQLLAREMRDAGYEKIDDRPLVYFFPGQWQPLLARLRQICKEENTPDPFAVVMSPYGNTAPEDKDKVEGICAYACAGDDSWEGLCKISLELNEKRIQTGIPCIPHFTVGWDPTPRIQNPVPWVAYLDKAYHAPCSREQLLSAAEEFKTWVSDHRGDCVTGHILVFAWNEFEEGAWICPTLGADNQPDFRRRDAFAEAAKLLRS